MIVLVTGGSGCGKSTWAEKLVASLPNENRVYIATMRVYDDESVKRVERHRAQRADKGFRTIECEKDLASADIADSSVVLLEDLVNLMANEMFDGGDVSRIVPALNITKRFVGKEPFDKATNAYNQKMKEILTPLGIEVHEIERLTDGYQAVSASRVRRI